MPTNETGEEIIEKRDSNPVATSFLVVAAVVILAAMGLQIAEIGELNAKLSAAERAGQRSSRAVREFETRANEIIDSSPISAEDVERTREVLEEHGMTPTYGTETEPEEEDDEDLADEGDEEALDEAADEGEFDDEEEADEEE